MSILHRSIAKIRGLHSRDGGPWLRRRDPGTPDAAHAAIRSSGHDPGRRRASRPPSVRQHHPAAGGPPRHADHSHPRVALDRRSASAARLPEAAHVCGRGRADPGARDRREHRDLQHLQCGVAGAAAVCRRRPHRDAVGADGPHAHSRLGGELRRLAPAVALLRQHGGDQPVLELRAHRPRRAGPSQRRGRVVGLLFGPRHAGRRWAAAFCWKRINRTATGSSSCRTPSGSNASGSGRTFSALPSASTTSAMPSSACCRRSSSSSPRHPTSRSAPASMSGCRWHSAPTPSRGSHPLRVFARLKPDVALEQAQAEVAAIGAQLAAAYPEENKEKGVTCRAAASAGDRRRSARAAHAARRRGFRAGHCLRQRRESDAHPERRAAERNGASSRDWRQPRANCAAAPDREHAPRTARRHHRTGARERDDDARSDGYLPADLVEGRRRRHRLAGHALHRAHLAGDGDPVRARAAAAVETAERRALRSSTAPASPADRAPACAICWSSARWRWC